MPEKKPVSERELRRIETRRKRHGEDFDSINGRHAAQFNKTKFNSETGRIAAKKKWAAVREKQAKDRGETPGGTVL